MVYLTLCNPETQVPFPSFKHHTTTYVSVPHGCPTRLWVGTDKICHLGIAAEVQLVLQKQVKAPGELIDLTGVNQPITERGGFIPPFLNAFRRGRSEPVDNPRPQRLFAFTATVSDRKPEAGGNILSSVEYHVLCPTDFDWARALHLQVMEDPQAITPWTIADKAEGDKCPLCHEVRARLRKDWEEQS